jgi:hypothetical protein
MESGIYESLESPFQEEDSDDESLVKGQTSHLAPGTADDLAPFDGHDLNPFGDDLEPDPPRDPTVVPFPTNRNESSQARDALAA